MSVESKEKLLWKKSPTRAIKDFWSYILEAGEMSWAVPLCLLCSYTFPQASAAWLDLGWFYKCGMLHALSDRFLVQGVGEPVAFTGRCTLGPFCRLSVIINMTLGFLLLCP